MIDKAKFTKLFEDVDKNYAEICEGFYYISKIIAHKWAKSDEDAVSYIVTELIRGIKRFDVSYGRDAFSYALDGAKFALIQYWNRESFKKQKAESIRINAPNFVKAESDPTDFLEIELLRNVLDNNLAKLNDKQLQVIKTRYFHRVSMEVLGERMGISGSRVQQIEIQALGKIKRLMQRMTHGRIEGK